MVNCIGFMVVRLVGIGRSSRRINNKKNGEAEVEQCGKLIKTTGNCPLFVGTVPCNRINSFFCRSIYSTRNQDI